MGFDKIACSLFVRHAQPQAVEAHNRVVGGLQVGEGPLQSRPQSGQVSRGEVVAGGEGLEADVVAVLPVPAGHRAVHAGALGAYRLQFDASFHCWNGTVHGLRVHASAHHGNIALL